MSETYFIIKNIIKNEYKTRYSWSRDRKKLLWIFIASSIFTFAGLVASPIITIIRNGLLAIGIIGIIIFFILIVRKKKEELPKDPIPFIAKITEQLSKYVNSVAIINELETEIDNELLKHEKKRQLFFKRISVIFVSIFWLPACYLTKQFLEADLPANPMTVNQYVSFIMSLLSITTYLIGLTMGAGEIFNSAMEFEDRDLQLTKNHLNDIKYQYLHCSSRTSSSQEKDLMSKSIQ